MSLFERCLTRESLEPKRDYLQQPRSKIPQIVSIERAAAMPSPAISRGWEVQRESAMTAAIRPKARDLIAPTWQSQASRSLFLVLLVISIFVLPARGGQRVNIKLASDIVGSLTLIAGVAIAWAGECRRRLALVAMQGSAMSASEGCTERGNH